MFIITNAKNAVCVILVTWGKGTFSIGMEMDTRDHNAISQNLCGPVSCSGWTHLNFRCLTDISGLFIGKRCLLTDRFVRTETVDSSISREKNN